MGPYKRKSIFFMQFRDVVYQPGFGGMTACAIVTNRLVMDIRMAGGTFHRGLIKHQGTVAEFAISLGMGAFQGEIRGIVVKLKGIVIDCPPGRMVAFNAIHFQLVPMGGLPKCRQAA